MAEIGINVYAKEFAKNILRTVELAGGKLRSTFAPGALKSGETYREEGIYQRLTGGGLMNKRTVRFGDSPVSDVDYSRRRVTRDDFEDGQFMDWSDIHRMCVDPKSEKLDVMTQKWKRTEDKILIQALLGDAMGGDNGETPVPFDTANVIPVNSEGLSYEKVVLTLEHFGNLNVDIENIRPVGVISWRQWKDLMNDAKYINKDYRASDAVNSGARMVKDFLGCDWIITNMTPYVNAGGDGADVDDSAWNFDTGAPLDVAGNDVRSCFFYCPDAAILEINPDLKSRIAERADKGFNWYAYFSGGMGAVRMEEEKVIIVPCDQSPAP